MKNTKITQYCIFFSVLLILTACNKSDDSPETTSDTDPVLIPQFSCDIDGEPFIATTVFSRYQSDERFAISATDSLGNSFYFSLQNFVGNGTYPTFEYPIGEVEPVVKLTLVSNADSTHYYGKANYSEEYGSINVNSYTQSPPVLGGAFYVTLVEAGNTQNVIEVTNGTFSDIPVLPKLSSSPPGVITYWQAGKKYESSISEAILFKGMYYALTFQPENEPTERYRYRQNIDGQNPPNDPHSILYSQWYPENEFAFDQFYDCYGMGANVSISIDNDILEGSAGSYGKDFEMYFEGIPITVVPETDMTNKLCVNTEGGLIIFTEIDTFQYDLSNENLKITIRASNSAGQILKVFSYNGLPFTFNDCDVSIETQIDITNPDGTGFSYNTKCISQRNLDTELTRIAGDGFDFESFDDFNPWLYGEDIPYTTIY